jgi:hypothetical protein
MSVVMQGPVGDVVPVEIIQKMKRLAPENWSSEDFIIGQICVTYDYTHQAWTDSPDVDFVFDVDEQINTMFKWADYLIKEHPDECETLRKMWKDAGSYKAQNWSCSTSGEISEFLFDLYDDFFL